MQCSIYCEYKNQLWKTKTPSNNKNKTNKNKPNKTKPNLP